jgi:hypothetical protein
VCVVSLKWGDVKFGEKERKSEVQNLKIRLFFRFSEKSGPGVGLQI